MAKLIIEGGRALKGQITVRGAKNAALRTRPCPSWRRPC